MVVHAVAHERRALQFPAAAQSDLASLTLACMAWDPRERPVMQEIAHQLQVMVHQHFPDALVEDS
jgi:hypothetical protein